MLFAIIAMAVFTLAAAVFLAEFAYPGYVSEKRRMRGELKIAIRDVKEFRKLHTAEVLRHNLFWQREFNSIVHNRDRLSKELSRMKIEIIALTIVCALAVIAGWMFVLYKLML